MLFFWKAVSFSLIGALSIILRMSSALVMNSAAFRLDKLRWVLISKTPCLWWPACLWDFLRHEIEKDWERSTDHALQAKCHHIDCTSEKNNINKTSYKKCSCKRKGGEQFAACKDDSIEIQSEDLRKDLLPETVSTISAHQTILPSESELRILPENFLPSSRASECTLGKPFSPQILRLSKDFKIFKDMFSKPSQLFHFACKTTFQNRTVTILKLV